MWFFATERLQGFSQYINSSYYNQNAGNPNSFLYAADLSRPAFEDHTWENTTLRLTWQASNRNKINIFWDEQIICPSCENGGLNANALFSPEANGKGDFYPQRTQQVTWTSAWSNRLLLESGFGGYIGEWGGRPKTDPYTQDLARIVEQCTAGCPANGNIAGLSYRSQSNIGTSDAHNLNETYTWRASASYVTGASSLKIGYLGYLSSGPHGQLPRSQRPGLPVQQRRAKPAHRVHPELQNRSAGCGTMRCLPRNNGRSSG